MEGFETDKKDATKPKAGSKVAMPKAAAPSMKADALFIHSLDDEQCPASEGKRAAEAWPGARFWPVDGLGHRALVQDDEVVSMAASWLDS